MLYIVYIIKIGPALRKKKVKSREIHDFFNFIQGNLVFLWKIAKIQGNLGISRKYQGSGNPEDNRKKNQNDENIMKNNLTYSVFDKDISKTIY